MYASTSEIVQKANHIVRLCGTRDPHRIADELGIEIMYCPFKSQRGAYKVIMRNRFMFVKEDLHPVMENIVLLHELGHDSLHRDEATKVGGFKEFNIFDIRDSRMEYEANIFATQIALPDDDFLELAEQGYDVQQIARTMHSDVNLVALKADTLISQGYRLRPQEHRNDFLKYNR
ncbi:ImmA/IrrE family metallo-endopeptidase [Neglecta sp. X4]|uniref:ImmA/IrrE family metallo-endopeptidase n=1 Tax=unclassified Neglectibacter TaxID=2632164 RepID=UPI00136A081A|nr:MULTISPECIES: ImmA/IrrE family metallo-endopeptidase [unclassified Neglectibacter]NBI16634.1 ImmA/IrrE family metallo-endopeptidase [Neglectibacter sp. 59]NBJ72914.1 ImmA/IrrE family metallo-endopeptidase [Neglectibacter sp. X4]NCE80890.1 ImmA/IrrE family metallo-endopeptidase [Neglectibacter sp. X58]